MIMMMPKRFLNAGNIFARAWQTGYFPNLHRLEVTGCWGDGCDLFLGIVRTVGNGSCPALSHFLWNGLFDSKALTALGGVIRLGALPALEIRLGAAPLCCFFRPRPGR